MIGTANIEAIKSQKAISTSDVISNLDTKDYTTRVIELIKLVREAAPQNKATVERFYQKTRLFATKSYRFLPVLSDDLSADSRDIFALNSKLFAIDFLAFS